MVGLAEESDPDEIDGMRESERERVCVCVCVRERERVRERTETMMPLTESPMLKRSR